MSHQFFHDGKLVSGWAEPKLHIYQDGEKQSVALGRYARAHLTQYQAPQMPRSGGFVTLREIDIPADNFCRGVWDDRGQTQRLFWAEVVGDDKPSAWVLAELSCKGYDVDFYDCSTFRPALVWPNKVMAAGSSAKVESK